MTGLIFIRMGYIIILRGIEPSEKKRRFIYIETSYQSNYSCGRIRNEIFAGNKGYAQRNASHCGRSEYSIYS